MIIILHFNKELRILFLFEYFKTVWLGTGIDIANWFSSFNICLV